MIDIAFDMHQDNTFCGEVFSVIEIENELQSWADYKKFAQLFIQQHSQEKTVVVKVTNSHFSINKFSVALFVSSFNLSCPLNLVVFKVDDLEQACEGYKPYLALTVALKYVLQLINEPAETIYKNAEKFAGLSELLFIFLKINIKQKRKRHKTNRNKRENLKNINVSHKP